MLASWKKSYDQPRQHIKKQRLYFAIKVHLVKAMVFPVIMYGCESWTIKKAEHWRIDAFEIWYWRRLFRVPWTARRSSQSTLKKKNQSWIFTGRTDCWSWNSNTLATWCEEWTHWKRPWCWERLKAGGEGVTEDEMAGWHHRLNGHEFEQAPGVGDGQGSLACCSPWITKSRTRLSYWTELKVNSNCKLP